MCGASICLSCQTSESIDCTWYIFQSQGELHPKNLLFQYMTWHCKVRVSFLKYIYSPTRYTMRFHWVSFYWSLRLQLYMFRTSWVHLQELLCRHCICRLWHVVIHILPGTSSWYNLPHAIACIYSVYTIAPEDGPMRSDTWRAATWVINKNLLSEIALRTSLDYIYISVYDLSTLLRGGI